MFLSDKFLYFIVHLHESAIWARAARLHPQDKVFFNTSEKSGGEEGEARREIDAGNIEIHARRRSNRRLVFDGDGSCRGRENVQKKSIARGRAKVRILSK